jgi:glycosyltransferase involved in cell wall biosynthesis
MKIGINASFLRKPGTGIGQVTTQFLRALALSPDMGKHEYVLYLEEDADISFLPGNVLKRIYVPWWKRDDVPRKWLWERAIPRLAQEDGCDVFLSLYQSATVFHGCKHVMIVHDIIPKLFPEYLSKWSQRFYWKAVERSIMQADRIIAVSKSTQDDLISKLSVKADRITVSYPDVDDRFSARVTDETLQKVMGKFDLNRGYIYHGGGLEVRKNTENLLRAYALLREKEEGGDLGFPLPPLVISGKLFPSSNRLATDVRRIVRELDLEARVRLLGFVPDEDIPSLYTGALFFAYPSMYEGFGLPLLEALRIGTPVLASSVSSVPEVCGTAALYCDPKSIESIARGMEQLLTDDSLRKELSMQGKAQASRFNWKHFTQMIIDSLSL